MKIWQVSSLVAIVFLFSCANNNEADEAPTPTPTAVTTPGQNLNNTASGITYAAQVVPILKKYNCTGCHGSSGGVSLENYNSVKSIAQSGRLYGSMARQSGFAAMPPSGTVVNGDDLKVIQQWITDGYKE